MWYSDERNPGMKELTAVGITAGMSKDKCRQIAEDIQACVTERLVEYLED